MRAAVALAPGDPGLRTALGQAQASAGQVEAAIESFRAACRRQPDGAWLR